MALAESLPPDASTASTGLGLRYIGRDYAYAYSGLYQIASSDVLHLDYTTGSGFIVGNFICSGAVLAGTLANGTVSVFKINFNDLEIVVVKVDTATEDMPTLLECPLVIPPFTRVTVNVESGASFADMKTSIQLIGRVYEP